MNAGSSSSSIDDASTAVGAAVRCGVLDCSSSGASPTAELVAFAGIDAAIAGRTTCSCSIRDENSHTSSAAQIETARTA